MKSLVSIFRDICQLELGSSFEIFLIPINYCRIEFLNFEATDLKKKGGRRIVAVSYSTEVMQSGDYRRDKNTWGNFI